MIKFLYTITALLAVFWFTSCNNKDAKKIEELQAKLDSTAWADSIRNAEAEQLELAQKEWDEFTSPDSKSFFDKGHVK